MGGQPAGPVQRPQGANFLDQDIDFLGQFDPFGGASPYQFDPSRFHTHLRQRAAQQQVAAHRFIILFQVVAFSLDRIMNALGATVIDYPLKTHCCSGHMTQISPPVAYEMIRRIIAAADQYRADLLVTLCPMCQLNLDAYQGDMNKHFGTDYQIPVLYFTQLMGLAFGHPAESLGLGQEFVSSQPALAKIGVEVPVPAQAAPVKRRRRAKDDPSLPMPKPLDDKEENA